MAHCFACNLFLTNPVEDRPTGRCYCVPCFEPTIKVQLALAEAEENRQYRDNREVVDWMAELPNVLSIEDEVESVQDYLFRENMDLYEEELKEFEEY